MSKNGSGGNGRPLKREENKRECILDYRDRRRRDFQIRRKFSWRTRAERVKKSLTPRAMPCTRNSSEALMSLPPAPPPLPFLSRMRDAPHTSDFLTSPGDLAAPIPPRSLSLLDDIFLVFRA